MMSKSEEFKKQYGCKTCKYEHRMTLQAPCLHCSHRVGSEWKKHVPKPKKVYCECCGKVKG